MPTTKILSLIENSKGISLSAPDAELIAKGEKTLILESLYFKDKINTPLYLIQEGKCYGVIKLEEPFPITNDEYINLKDKHKLSDNEGRLFEGKDFIFAYPFELLKAFTEPKDITLPKDNNLFLESVEFLVEGGTSQADVRGSPGTLSPLLPIRIANKKKGKKWKLDEKDFDDIEEGYTPEEDSESDDYEIENSEEEKILNVVQRGDRWCVVHGHPKKEDSKTDKPIGTVIHCFPTKEEAIAMHKAIIISEAKRKDMSEINLIDSIYSEIEEVIKNLP